VLIATQYELSNTSIGQLKKEKVLKWCSKLWFIRSREDEPSWSS